MCSMGDIDFGREWWTLVTGPRTMTDDLVAALCEQKNVVLALPTELPFKEEMRAAMWRAIDGEEELSLATLLPVRADSLLTDPFDFGHELLEQFAPSEIAKTYRPDRGTVWEYIKANRVLPKSIVWAEDFSGATGENVVGFCRDCCSSSLESGLVVAEVSDISFGLESSKGLKVLNWSDYVNVADVRAFAMLLAARLLGSMVPDGERLYAATLSFKVCRNDVESAVGLMSVLRDHDYDVRAALEDLHMGGGLVGEHGLSALVGEGKWDEIERRVWEAQVEVLFPKVERRRIDIISRLEAPLRSVLDSEEGVVQYDERIVDLNDVELGTLVYLVASRRLDVGDSGLRDEIHFLRDVRNSMAHVDLLEWPKVRRVLELS